MLLVCWLTAAGRQSCWLAILWAGLLAGCGLLAIGSLSLAGNLAGWFAGWLRLAGNQVRSSFVLHGMLTAHTALVTNRCYMAAGAFGS
jgi:hypothetical protein